MIGYSLCKLLPLHVRCAGRAFTTCEFHSLQNPFLASSVRFISTKSPPSQHLFTVSYLIDNFGFSPESALSASRYVHFKTSRKPDSIIAFLKGYGFSHTQISKIIKRRPTMLLCADPNSTWMPKLEFLQSLGLPHTDIMNILSHNPEYLRRSLNNHIIPNFNFLKSFLHSNEKIVFAFKRYQGILNDNFSSNAEPKIAILREHGVPEKNITTFIAYYPRAFMSKTAAFKDTVGKIKKMGFNPLKLNFVQAAHAMRAMKNSTWERKIEIYKSWGLSEEEIRAAFRKDPWCMTKSEDKIKAVMNFLVNTLGWDASIVIRSPMALSSSYDRKIVPRCWVIQDLLLKGLVKKDLCLVTFLMQTEKKFLHKLETTYGEEAPRLLRIYWEKMKLQSQREEDKCAP